MGVQVLCGICAAGVRVIRKCLSSIGVVECGVSVGFVRWCDWVGVGSGGSSAIPFAFLCSHRVQALLSTRAASGA